MTVRVLQSTDAGAPVLNGTVGSMITVLDACLVNGFGAKTALGWSKAFSDTNSAVYRASSGNQAYLNVNDTIAQYCWVTGYMNATGVGAGTDVFPRKDVFTSGLAWGKSSTANATAVAWMIIGNEKCFYFWINFGQGAAPYIQSELYFFGDINTYRASDHYNSIIIGCTTVTTISSIPNNSFMYELENLVSTGTPGHYIARGFHQFGTSQGVGKHSNQYFSGTAMGRGQLLFPNPADGSLTLAPVYIHESGSSQYPIRGTMPGMWAPCHLLAGQHWDTFTGNTSNTFVNGKTFMLVNMWATGSVAGQAAIEISDTW